MKLNPRLDKLRKLAAHLRTVPPENFDFGTVWCGTVGCAMGHAVSVFPEELALGEADPYDGFRDTEWMNGSAEGYIHCAKRVFNIEWNDASDLFTPRFAQRIHEDLPRLDRYSHPTEVADMLEQFCQLVESGKLEQYEI